MHVRLLALLLPCLLLIAGCSSGRPERVPVSGKVTIDGEPLSYGYVRLIPEHGRLSTGELDEQGRFTLTAYESGDGVQLGLHRIEVLAGEPISDTRTHWHAPKQYARRASSGLTTMVDGATDDLKINLTWNGRQPYTEVTD